MIFPPNRALCEPDEVGARDEVMVAYFASTQAGEEPFRVVRVGLSVVLQAVGFLVVDPIDRELGR